MPYISTLLELFLAGQSFKLSKTRLNGLMKGLASILIFTVVSAIFGLLASISIYAILFLVMTSHGIDYLTSLAVLLAFTLAGLFASLASVHGQWQKLKHAPEIFLRPNAPLGDAFHKIGDAFMNGFTNSRPSAKPR